MTNSQIPWIVETAEDKEICYHERKAIGVAEDFQLKGKDVCIYHDGKSNTNFQDILNIL
tara:strand:+ start:314 stop:490 length:177 start_codon:yes stop_codon:yes gene_type:complete